MTIPIDLSAFRGRTVSGIAASQTSSNMPVKPLTEWTPDSWEEKQLIRFCDHAWPFSTTLKKALQSLADKELISFEAGNTDNCFRASLTEEGKRKYLFRSYVHPHRPSNDDSDFRDYLLDQVRGICDTMDKITNLLGCPGCIRLGIKEQLTLALESEFKNA